MKENIASLYIKKPITNRIAISYITSIFKGIFDKRTPSILLITLIYLIKYWNSIYNSVYYDNRKIIAYLLVLISIQCLVFLMYKSSNKFLNFMVIVLFSVFVIFWHGTHLINWINNWQIYIYKYQVIRGRLIILIIGAALFLLEYTIHLKKPGLMYVQNIFTVILCIILITLNFIKKSELVNINSFKNSYLPINVSAKKIETKPIILIISDEYNSPSGLVNVTKDISLYNFAKELSRKGWIIKDSFYSYEVSTIHSISSLYNFNLSYNKMYSNASIEEIGSEKLMKAKLSDSLKKRNIEIINYGIFDLGKSKPINRLYYYPKNLFELIVYYSIYPFVFNNTGELKLQGFKNSFYAMEIHNKFILNNLMDTLSSNKDKNKFVYVHLFMPHVPMTYDTVFKYRANNLKNYIEFWKFTNKKVSPLLDSIIKLNKYRIILTGDHGYRSSLKNIDPHYTFGAFYGFDEIDIYKIKSVQDLGSLIVNYFKH